GKAELAGADGGAVGPDLGPGGPELGGVVTEGDDRVAALRFDLLDQPFGRVLAAFLQHLRHALELAAGEGLERSADLRAAVARADGEAEELARDLVDLVPGAEVVHGGDDHGGQPSRRLGGEGRSVGGPA